MLEGEMLRKKKFSAHKLDASLSLDFPSHENNFASDQKGYLTLEKIDRLHSDMIL